MKQQECDKLLDLNISQHLDHNSLDFDLMLLEELKAISVQPDKFDSVVKKIMLKKSSCKLWWSNNPTRIWDGKQYHDANYRCCPSSRKARHYFCLLLDRKPDTVTVINGWLSSI